VNKNMNFQQPNGLQKNQLDTASPPQTVAVRATLRTETAQAHRRLDSLAARFDLCSDKGCSDFLRASAAALIPVEHALERMGVAQFLEDWPARARAGAILADLEALGVTVSSGASPVSLPSSRSGLFGALYVLEGSRLGARALLKQLEAAGDRVRSNLRYLEHGNDKQGGGADLWRTFAARLEGAVTDAPGLEAAVAGAHTVFGVFLDCFAGRATS
jgi:heme oxygenase